METAITMSSISFPTLPSKTSISKNSKFQFIEREFVNNICSISHKTLISRSTVNWAGSRSVGDVHRTRSSLESLFCYDKPVPEEIIEEPIGVSLAEKKIGENPPCIDCEAKGAILCPTCTGSGLYIDSIMECQGIIVKVRCLGCGGTGNILCSDCGGRGHLGVK